MNQYINASLFNRPGRYLIISTMRNEIKTIEATICSVLAQTQLPKFWLILDDGSTDGSIEIIKRYVKLHPWIVCVSLPDRGYDLIGKGVADLLNYGLELIESVNVEFVAKLDTDLKFAADYYQKLIKEMDDDPLLGIISGYPYIIKNGKRVLERHSDYFPSGVARLYRYDYLLKIGAFPSSIGWDTVDILRMRMHGFNTKISQAILVHHLRRMGTRHGYFDGMTRAGRNNYLTGYFTLFFVLRAFYNGIYYPYIIRTLCMLFGYLQAYLSKQPLAVTEAEHLFHVNLQRKRLGLQAIDKL